MNGKSAAFHFRSAGTTHAGTVRSLNEDAFLDAAEAGLWAVADGVGGHAAGDYASQLVINALDRIGLRRSAAELLAAVRDKLDAANANLRAFAANEGVDLTATTVAALLCFGQHYAAVWAGDSRIYLRRGGRLSTITRDHTAVQELVDAGAITPEQAQAHPRRNVITRAVGADTTLELEMTQDRLEPNDQFLLCTDGLTKVVSDDEIAAMLAVSHGGEASARLIELALERGAPDNVTVVVVECTAEDG